MRTLTKATIALGFVGALTLGGASPTLAQGVYLQGPGVEFGIGRPAYRDRYYRSEPYAYYGRPYYDRGPYMRRHYNRRGWDW
jgi:hypothetical protein